MERLEKIRQAQRSICTHIVNSVKCQLNSETIEPVVWALIEAGIGSIQHLANALSELDHQIYEAMLDADVSDEVWRAHEFSVAVHEVRALRNARSS